MWTPTQGAGLAAVARWVGQHEVARQVARVLRERNEVVDFSFGQCLSAVKTLGPIDLSKLQDHGQQRLPGSAKQGVFKVIRLPDRAGVPVVALDVLDPERARQLLHQWLDASQAVHDHGLEPDLTGVRPGRSRTDALCWQHRLGIPASSGVARLSQRYVAGVGQVLHAAACNHSNGDSSERHW